MAQSEVAVPHKYIVVVKSNVTEDALSAHIKLANEHQQNSVSKLAELHAFSNNSGVIKTFDINGNVKGYTGYFAPETIEYLRGTPEVDFIEQDSVVKAMQSNAS